VATFALILRTAFPTLTNMAWKNFAEEPTAAPIHSFAASETMRDL
jgi:hypothetical protein